MESRSVGPSSTQRQDANQDASAHAGQSHWGPSLSISTSQKVCYDFIAYESDKKRNGTRTWRRTLRKILHSTCFESTIAMIVLVNLILICMDTDARADSTEAVTRSWVSVAMDFIFATFVLELVLRLIVEQGEAFSDGWTILDAVICVTGAFEYVFSKIGINVFGIGMLRILRLCRLLRLLRVLKLLGALKELKKLIQMMSSCLKTLFWSSLLLFIVMTLWACIAVEVLHPYMQKMSAEGAWSNCERCSRAFSSVFMANLTLFQTIIAGDSWGLLAVPLIEAHPPTAFVLAGTLITLIFGVLNLIVAVVVDTFAEMRAKDIVGLAHDMDYEEAVEKKALQRIFKQIDEDMSGNLSYEELNHGAKSVAEFRHWLRVLDIDAQDLKELFHMVDADGNGEIDPAEFIDAMYRLKNTESKTAAKFVKHLVTKMEKRQSQIDEALKTMDSRRASLHSVCATSTELRQHLQPVPSSSISTSTPPELRQDLQPVPSSSISTSTASEGELNALESEDEFALGSTANEKSTGPIEPSLQSPSRWTPSKVTPSLSCSQPFVPCSRDAQIVESKAVCQSPLGMTCAAGFDMPIVQGVSRFERGTADNSFAGGFNARVDAECVLNLREKCTSTSLDAVV